MKRKAQYTAPRVLFRTRLHTEIAVGVFSSPIQRHVRRFPLMSLRGAALFWTYSICRRF